MKKEVMEKWTKALRSGEYKQGRNVLRVGDSYCCLGVLCDIYQKETGLTEWRKFSLFSDRFHMDGNFADLPSQVLGFSGINSCFGRTHNGVSLSSLNDRGFSFEEIADIIEQNWEIL